MSAPARHSVPFAGREIAFRLERSARRRTLGITVTAEGEVVVRAPEGAAVSEVEARVARRGAWILRALGEVARTPPRTPERLFVPGETHLYLGKQYRLDVRRSLKERVRIEGEYIVLEMHRPGQPGARAELLASWYVERARALYEERLDALFPPFAARGHARPEILVRELEKRWGSLTGAGTVVLSRDLIRAPQACIDYVIIHELCHLEEPNHGAGFWKLLGRLMPDWEGRKEELEACLA